MTAWDQFFENDVPEKLGKFLVQTCVLRVLQLVDGQDAQAMLLLEHFQSLHLEEAIFMVSF